MISVKRARNLTPLRRAAAVKRFEQSLSVVLLVCLTLAMLSLSGCAKLFGPVGSQELPLRPTISSPAIRTDGVLRIGVDSTNAPFSGLINIGEIDQTVIGIDVDVAASIADTLGLKLEIVDIAGLSIDTLLADGTVDAVMSIDPDTIGFSGLQVGPYIVSGPALFTIVKSTTVPNLDLASLAGTQIAASVGADSAGTASSHSLEEIIGPGTTYPEPSLTEAFEALVQNEVAYAAADAINGSYMALEYQDVACVKIFGAPIGVYMGVAADNFQLADALTDALRTIRDNGILKIVYTKWLGPISASVVMGSSAITSQNSAGAAGAIDTGDDLPDPANAG